MKWKFALWCVIGVVFSWQAFEHAYGLSKSMVPAPWGLVGSGLLAVAAFGLAWRAWRDNLSAGWSTRRLRPDAANDHSAPGNRTT